MSNHVLESEEIGRSNVNDSLYLSNNAPFEIILKIQETCNLNCKYCYMYNLGNNLYREVPPSSSIETCSSVARMICHEFAIREPASARLILHGGEPLLMPIHRFVERMEAIEDIFSKHLTAVQRERVGIFLQTNATLVSDAWIEVFHKYRITVGVSIDGTATSHDEYRIDHSGKGSHEAMLLGLAQLKNAANAGLIPYPGALCVINPNASGKETYEYIVNDCGLTNVDFLFPFRDWTNYSATEVASIGKFLKDAFYAWARGRRRDVSVRVFRDTLNALLGKHHQAGNLKSELNGFYVVVESDGSIMPDETLRSSIPSRFCGLNASDVCLSDILVDESFSHMIRQSYSIPEECEGCSLRPSCGGGYNIGRYGMRYDGTGYHRKSVFCEAYKDLYATAIAYLQVSGASITKLSLN